MEINPETLEIEIVDIEPIEGGVQVFARAWSDGQQIGFGTDGTVDIERFRILNPPILVEDPEGDIINTSYTEDPITFLPVEHISRFREDLVEALLQVIQRNLAVMKNLHSADLILPGKRGNTVSTFFSGIGDGWLGKSDGGSFSANRNATAAQSGQLNYTGTEQEALTLHSANQHIRRAFLPIDTSALPDSDTISSATFSVYVYSSQLSGTAFLDGAALVQTSQPDPSLLALADYDALTYTLGAPMQTVIPNATTGWLNFPLNSTGLSWLNPTGFTKLGVLGRNDFENTSLSSGFFYQRFRYADYTGTTSDPKLVVEHAAGGGTDYDLDADTQTYVLTGTATGLYHNRKVAAPVASFALTGRDATFTRQLSLRAETASFGITANDAPVLKHSVISAEPATYTLIGYASFFPKANTLGASTGVFSVTANDAQLLRHYVMPCAPATFALTGNGAITAYNRTMDTETTDFELDTSNAQFLRSLAILGAPATYQLTGSDAGIAKGFAIAAEPSVYALTSSPTLLTRGYSMVAETEAFMLSGVPVAFIVGAPPITDPFSPGTSQMSRRSGIFTARDPIGQRAPRP